MILHHGLQEDKELSDRVKFGSSITFSYNFPTYGVFDCTINIVNAIDSYTDTWTFTVQYAIEDVQFGLWNVEDLTTFTVLTPPDFSKTLTFVLLKSTARHLPTNVSYTIDFGLGGEVVKSSKYIADDDSTRYITLKSYDHVISFLTPVAKAGDYEATLHLYNLISEKTLSYAYRIYDQVHDLEITNITHQVSDWLLSPVFPRVDVINSLFLIEW